MKRAKPKFRVVGYMGVVNGKAWFDEISDSYCNSTERVRIAEVFKYRLAAKRRYEVVVKVTISEIGPRPKQGGKPGRKKRCVAKSL